MDAEFLPETMRGRLVDELRRELPSGMGEKLDDLITAVFNFHEHRPAETEPLAFDFRSLGGETLLPERDEGVGVAEFLKLSQTFERSMVGLIRASDLSGDEKTRFVGDVQSFFDNFDTALLGQLEEELVARGLLRSAVERMDDLTRESRRFQTLYRLSSELSKGYDIESIFGRLADELSDAIDYDVILLHIHNPVKGRALFHIAEPAPEGVLDTLWRRSLDALREYVHGIDDIDVEARVTNPDALASAEHFEAGEVPGGDVALLPLRFEDEVLGSLGLHLPEGKKLSDEDALLFTTFTNQLALALKNMVAVERMRKLLRDNREQIDLARRVQMGLLSEPGKFKRLKFHKLFKPAAGLSGDFYQFFSNREMEGLIIGDASGHGISASLIMAVAGATFRDVCSPDICDPAEMLTRANASLKAALGDDFFVTAFVFGLNPDTLQAAYSTAGQAGPILIKPDGKLRQLSTTGFPLGMFDEPPEYTLRRAQLTPGDRLLFFTDGAIEGHNVKGELYGMKRLRACIKRNIDLSCKALLHAVADDISAFLSNSPRADDMTLVLMEVK